MGAVRFLLVASLALAPGLTHAAGWKPIFNGRNLEGWTPKVAGHPLGENWRDTFRVEKGVLKVAYDKYDRFNGDFAHLIYKTPLSAYRLRFEYRFLGAQTPGAPSWAVRNSGVMLHGEPPQTMGLNQPFPVSVEAQLRGGGPGETQPTGNVCTPGVTVSIGGVPMKEHCRNSTSRTYPDGEWVKFEVEVHGARLVRHIVDGETVMEYGDVRLDPTEFARFAPGTLAYADRGAEPLSSGYISLQAEGHPLEFRRIELLELPD